MKELMKALENLYPGVSFRINPSEDDDTICTVIVDDEDLVNSDEDSIQISDLVLQYTDYADVEVVSEDDYSL